MGALGRTIAEFWPYLGAAAVGYAIPRRDNLFERLSIALVGLLAVALVSGLWRVTSGDGEPWPHLLSLIVFLPIAGALGVLFLPRQTPKLLQRFTLGVLALDFIASLYLLKVPMTHGWHFQDIHAWMPAFGIRYHVAVDGISLWMVLLSTLSTPIAVYVSFGSIKKRTKELCFAFLMLHGAMLGAFVSLDLFLFYVFWELMLIPMIVIIGVWGGVEKIKAAYKFFLYTMFGSVLMLAAILYMVWTHKQVAGFITFDYLALRRLILPETAAWFCFIAFALAFVIKVPMFPFHTWLPDAHVQAPTGGSIILAAVLLKLGTYGYIRFCMGMLEGPAWVSGATLGWVAVLGGITYGALCAWKQADIKRLVAYSSVAHLGFVMLGLFSATRAGMEGAILQMVNHGVSTGALFLLVGVIYDRRHTRLASEYGGIAKVMPIYTVLFVIVTMASVGVPGTNGFVGEFMVLMGTMVSEALGKYATPQTVVASFGVVLAAIYMLSVVQKVFFGPLNNPKNEHLEDLNVRETVALAPLIALIFVIGFFPGLFLERMHESVNGALDRYIEGRSLYLDHKSDLKATLRGLRGGPLEKGYPKAPGSEEEAAEPAEAAKPAAEQGVQP